MAKVKCAISGLELKISHVPIYLAETEGYYHPIFALPYRKLFGLYSKHCKGELTPTDSYLLFLAFLNATDHVDWQHCATCKPDDLQTEILVENNLRQLITVLECTNVITIPRFKQPRFVVRKENSNLRQVHSWIEAWEDNLDEFRSGIDRQKEHEELVKIEHKLTWYIKSGMDTSEYASVVANWAEKAAAFPPHLTEYWKKIIRSCFNSEKMFSTPLSDLKELKAYCEENIEPGSIHYHELASILKTGIANHNDFLGLSPSSLGYTLLPVDTTKNDIAVEAIKATAPKEAPQRKDYSSDLEFLRARLKYRVATAPTEKKE